MLELLRDAELRQACRLRLEALEQWLRRLVHSQLGNLQEDYLNAIDVNGNRIIRLEIARRAADRIADRGARYPRPVDALDLDDLILVICNPELFRRFFREPLINAFPEGRDEALTFLKRLVEARNRLAHANPVTLRQAERVVCYSGDVIDSLKNYYERMGVASAYNVPTILKVVDSLGNSFERPQLSPVHDGGVQLDLSNSTALRPGDVLAIEVEIDPTFERGGYSISWGSTKSLGSADLGSERVIVEITNELVAMRWNIQCRVTTNNSWHRMNMGVDDFLIIHYRVLPPV